MRKYSLFFRNIIVLLLLLLTLPLSGSNCNSKPKPKYFTFEDLRRGLRREEFYFANINKPVYAKVDLGFYPFYPASGWARHSVVFRIFGNPSRYRAKTSKVYTRWWNDWRARSFDWTSFSNKGGARGDLIFLRSNGKGPNLIKIFSNWTHVAIADRPDDQYVFESLPRTGVDVNYAPTTWGKNITHFTCKRIRTLSHAKIKKAIESAKANYQGLPYFPRVRKEDGLLHFLFRWSDMNDMESMYCSKLIYHTFKKYVSLNSDNTCAFKDRLNTPGAVAYSWVGVSPDDNYYADALGHDFSYSDNVNHL